MKTAESRVQKAVFEVIPKPVPDHVKCREQGGLIRNTEAGLTNATDNAAKMSSLVLVAYPKTRKPGSLDAIKSVPPVFFDPASLVASRIVRPMDCHHFGDLRGTLHAV